MIEPDIFMRIVATVGFPITVTAFLLWERMHRDKQLEVAIDNNSIILKELCVIIKERR